MTLWTVMSIIPLVMAIYSRDTLGVSLGFSFMAANIANILIPSIGRLLVEAGITGADMNKEKSAIIPESLGIAIGATYLSTMFMFFPFPFLNWSKDSAKQELPIYPFQQLGEYSSALLSICCMLFLGFADDVINVKWRHKIILPAIASLPLLMIYSVTCGITNVIVPIPLRFIFGNNIQLGWIYYLYMAALSIFCTHSINILAGVNGVEVGQTLVIGLFILINDVISIAKKEATNRHLFSIYMISPFVFLSAVLLRWNWYPAKVFVGDTFCYFAGMTFAVVGILGHFSKTLLLFFIPQILNFIYSVPQLFHLIPCPRHRLPRFDTKTGKLNVSTVKISKNHYSVSMIRYFAFLKIVKILDEDKDVIEINNMTLLNFLLIRFGPLHESHLACLLLSFQAVCNIAGLYIRHRLSVFLF